MIMLREQGGDLWSRGVVDPFTLEWGPNGRFI